MSSSYKYDPHQFASRCLLVARVIDHGVARNERPTQTSSLTPFWKEVRSRKEDYCLQSIIMVLMLSVKNACKLGWFDAKETEELLTLADEVGNCFCIGKEVSSEASVLMPTLSSVMSRYYPQYKLGHIIKSIEVKPGYGTYLMDFEVRKDLPISRDERIILLVAMKDDVETSSCIISPQQVNFLLNGKPVDKRTNVSMDHGPQIPTVIHPLLVYGINLLQAVGRFNGHYILVIAAMSTQQTSDLPAPQDYVQPDTIVSGVDSEISEGASRISLNCPISYKRIKIPAKGHICKHYQCFDLSNYIEINLKRPSWRCPLCNQSVNFTDLRVDRRMVKVLQDAGENVSEVTINGNGSWKVASNKDNSGDKTTNKQDENQADDSSAKSGHCNVFDLTGEDYEMDTIDRPELVHKKPAVNNNPPAQSIFPNSPSPLISRSSGEGIQYTHPFSQPANVLPSAVADGGISSGNLGIAPVLTDAVSPTFNREPNNFQGNNNHPTNSSIGLPPPSSGDSLQMQLMQGLLYGRPIPRNVTRVSSAIQALPVQIPSPSSHPHVRPMMNLPPESASPVPFQTPFTSNQQTERQWQNLQSHVNALSVSSMATASPQNLAASQQGAAMSSPCFSPLSSQTPVRSTQTLSQPRHLMQLPQTLSRPPHLMGSSQLHRPHLQQGVSPRVGVEAINTPSTVQRVHLPSQQAPSQMRPPQALPSQQAHSQMRPPQTNPSQQAPSQMRPPQRLPYQQAPPQVRPSQIQLPRNSSSLPQVVSRPENLIDLQQAEQNWRPTGRMRGALQGQAYSAALSQYMSPPPSTGPASPTPDNYQVLLTNRMIARATQMHNQSTHEGGTNIENGGTEGDASQG